MFTSRGHGFFGFDLVLILSGTFFGNDECPGFHLGSSTRPWARFFFRAMHLIFLSGNGLRFLPVNGLCRKVYRRLPSRPSLASRRVSSTPAGLSFETVAQTVRCRSSLTCPT